MPRLIVCCALLAALPLPGRAEQTVKPTEMLVTLKVQPQAAPKPALRYQLLPELKEMQPGNPIPNYLRALFEQDYTVDRESLSRAALQAADRAARMDQPDWQLTLKIKTDGIGLLLPDLQKMRSLAAGLQERFREEVQQQRFDDALVTAKTMFALARHTGENPTLIGDLVGIAIAYITIGPLEEMLEQPGAPNLYWALTNLPHPLISLDKGMQGERVLIASELRDLSDTTPLTPEQLIKLVKHIDLLRSFDGRPRQLETWLMLTLKTASKPAVAAARKRLLEYGLPEERLNSFPVFQVLLLDGKLQYEIRRDEQMKLMNLPTWQVEALAGEAPRPSPDALFDFLVPALQKVRRAQGRLDQRIALLRHVEAIRIYAAEHDGKLPATLTEVTVPLPVDPFNGKAFDYKVDGNTFHLRGATPKGEEMNPAYNLHYVVTVQK